MLVFKKNIYDKKEWESFGASRVADPEYKRRFDPHHFVEVALVEEEEIISFLERQPKQFWGEDGKKFYPHAYKIGGIEIIKKLLSILKQGFQDRSTWHHMNAYHLCLLYDVLIRFAFNFNHDMDEERLKSLPELQGKALQVDLFVKEYFTNTVFLLDEDRYNSLTPEEKLKLGSDCPCQFAVINGLLPTREEMELREARDYPYSIYV
ncbi:MAG: hypothetical protein COV67_12150 [Nitrospinae bacterium CG11_big_fil_rev_8_21_14_0_20_56_8]|nr:MAG: hypothetical protein COV67_12150 [Nitrospinae bacterium CG11_big_fil_rev_8_21_14_0_20_56_8]